MIMTTKEIPLRQLVHSKSNVRRTHHSRAVEALMASIEAHGLRQNLNVKPTTGNRYEVVAGGRRLEALRRLMKEGRIANDVVIPCAVLDEGDDPTEISLAENTLREAMHPDDQCAAFQHLVSEGMAIPDVAARFGVTETIVRQRLRLASVSPLLRTLFRHGKLDLSQMMAFALVEDHAAQEAAWGDLPDWNNGSDAIRRALTKEGMRAGDRLARFVGIEAYEAAGGVVITDLFGDMDEAVLSDAALVERLATERLEAEAGSIRAEGWQWVAIELRPDYTVHYGRVYPRAVDGSDEDVFDAADMARAGAKLTIGHDGALRVERGLVHPETLRREAKKHPVKSSADHAALNAAQIEDLSGHRTAALRLALARNNRLALASVVHALGLSLFYPAAAVSSYLELSAHSEPLDRHVKSPTECSAHADFASLVGQWLARIPSDPALLWGWCLTLDHAGLLDALGILAALSVNAVETKTGYRSGRAHADLLADALQLDMHAHWLPEVDGFFLRLSKAQMTAFLTQSGEVQQAAVVATLKKREAAMRTASALTARGWLPAPLLRSTARDAPGETRDDDDGEDLSGAD